LILESCGKIWRRLVSSRSQRRSQIQVSIRVDNFDGLTQFLSLAAMITRTQISLIASGDTFLPSTIDAPFSSTEDPGAIGRRGRYRGVPVPGGSATFSVPESEKDGIRHLHASAFPFLPILRAAGATYFVIHITYHYDHQCALGFDSEELQKLAEFGCTVAVDCWKNDDGNDAT